MKSNVDIIDFFGAEILEEYFDFLYSYITKFIEDTNKTPYVRLDKLILGNCVTNYFKDMMRLEYSHDMDNADIRVLVYTSYWLLRYKPIQIHIDVDTDPLDNKKYGHLASLNEQFLVNFILRFLLHPEDTDFWMLTVANHTIENFRNDLFHFLSYGFNDAKSLEMVLIAFSSGEAYGEYIASLKKH